MASLAQIELGSQLSEQAPAWSWAASSAARAGRKRVMADSNIESAKKLLASGVAPRDVAHDPSVSMPALYGWIPASAQA